MSFKSKLRVLTVCLILQAGVFMHCPMRLEQIEEMMQQMNQPKLARVLPSDEDRIPRKSSSGCVATCFTCSADVRPPRYGGDRGPLTPYATTS